MSTHSDFIRAKIAADLRTGRFGGRVVTRFPPEPNGFLHIGHAKSICLNFGLARETPGARCHLRFDDTNPETEDEMYVRSIVEDVRWLGFDWGEHLYYASDYFDAMYDFAEHLIRTGEAYVDSSSEDEIRDARGTVTEPGRPTAFRDRSVGENLDLFRRMRAGEFPNGAHVLRGRIDLASPNMLMRDPVLYRIRHAAHYRTGDEWCVYPLYDYAHPIEDALECVTHSLCTLEFENNRELYDWVVARLPRRRASDAAAAESMGLDTATADYSDALAPECRPEQTEFARLALDYTVMSKRRLLLLVKGGHVSGWDDPRMPTIAGLRRRGVTPESIRAFCDMIGVAKTNSRVDIGKLEYAIRDDLNYRAQRVMCVLRPLKIVITNYPAGETEWLDAPDYPPDVGKPGSRRVPFARELFIERDDFREDPPPGFFRLSPGGEARLKYAYVIRCDDVVKDETGEVVELRCTLDAETRGGATPDGRRVKGTMHWVATEHALPCEVRLYDRLFTVPDPDSVGGEDADFREFLNADSLVVLEGARIEPSVAGHQPGNRYQFERQGYFFADPVDSRDRRLVYNRTVTLRDAWEKPAAESAGRPQRERIVGEPGERTRPERTAALEARMREYRDALGLSEDEADVLTRDEETAALFEAARAALVSEIAAGATTGRGAPSRAAGANDDGHRPRVRGGGTDAAGVADKTAAAALAKWIVNELPRELRGVPEAMLPFSAAALGRLVARVESNVVSSSAAREVLAEMAASGAEPDEIIERRGLRQLSDDAALTPIIDELVAAEPAKVEAYRAGKTGLLGFFVGQVMRRTGGKADPERTRGLLEERLRGG